MRIGLFLASLPSYSETFIVSKIEGLREAGNDVIVLLANSSAEKRNFPYINPYPRKKALFLFFFPWVMLVLFLTRFPVATKFLKLERASGKRDLSLIKSLYINAHILMADRLDWLHFAFASFAIGRENTAEAIGAQMAVSLRGFDIGIYPLKKPGCYARLWEKIDKVHSISDDLYSLALKDGLLPSAPYQKIRPAIDTRRLLPKKNPGSISQPFVIVSVGRLEWKKGFNYALAAMRELKRKGFSFVYKIAGSGTIDEELRFAIHDMDLGDRVVLLGKLKHNEIFALLHSSDFYLQPSVQEGFCNSVVEAQGTGLLCIATTAEGLQENVLHEKTGWIVNKRDHFAIAETIQGIINLSPKERARITRQGMDRVNSEFDLERLKKEFTYFYAG